MFGNVSRRKNLIEGSFGKDPQEGISYYNAASRLDDVCVMHYSVADDEQDGSPARSMEIDDITWDDLEMDSIFLKINHTNSFVGEQYLYHKLHILDKGRDREAADKMESRLEYLDKNPKARLDIEAHLNGIGKNDGSYQLIDFIQNTELWKIGNTAVYHILQVLLIAAIVCAVVFHSIIAIVVAVAVALVNLTTYIILKQKYDMYLNSLADFKNIYDFSKWISAHHKYNGLYESEKVKKVLGRLTVMSGVLLGMNNRRQSSLSGDIIGMLFDYVWGSFLIDVSVFNYVMKTISKRIDDVSLLIDYVGEIDCEIAILSYRKYLKNKSGWCRPEINDKGIEVVGLVHPLLNKPVGNSIHLYDRAVITGANASGKSTFMKSLAINCILAQSINTCTAEAVSIKPINVFTCMSLRDDILSGESYYFREAKYLKRMLDVIDEEDDILIVIDEILKGTNTKERVAASKAIMKYISDRKCLAMLATHDNELTETDKYRKYYFTSTVEDNDIHFDYVLHEGICHENNAITLLDFLGYPAEIVKEARENVVVSG